MVHLSGPLRTTKKPTSTHHFSLKAPAYLDFVSLSLVSFFCWGTPPRVPQCFYLSHLLSLIWSVTVFLEFPHFWRLQQLWCVPTQYFIEHPWIWICFVSLKVRLWSWVWGGFSQRWSVMAITSYQGCSRSWPIMSTLITHARECLSGLSTVQLLCFFLSMVSLLFRS